MFNPVSLMILCSLVVLPAPAATAATGVEDFNSLAPQVIALKAAIPAGWKIGATKDLSKPAAATVVPSFAAQQLAGEIVMVQQGQLGSAGHAYLLNPEINSADLELAVDVMPLSGLEDQSGGVVFRYNSGAAGKDSFYIVRINSIGNDNIANLAIFSIKNGVRSKGTRFQLPVIKSGQFHNLRVIVSGARIIPYLNGIKVGEVTAAPGTDVDLIAEAGGAGLWAKGDSVIAFDNFEYTTK